MSDGGDDQCKGGVLQGRRCRLDEMCATQRRNKEKIGLLAEYLQRATNQRWVAVLSRQLQHAPCPTLGRDDTMDAYYCKTIGQIM